MLPSNFTAKKKISVFLVILNVMAFKTVLITVTSQAVVSVQFLVEITNFVVIFHHFSFAELSKFTQ